MAIRKYFHDFTSWLKRESSCVTPEPAPSNDIKPSMTDFGQFLRLQPPGGLDTSRDIDSERAPLLLSFTRHRRIPINWLAILEGSAVPSSWADEATRRRIETQWLIDSDLAHRIPAGAVVALEATDYCVRVFYANGLQRGQLFNEDPVPDGSLFVQENPARHDPPKLYALAPKSGKKLAAESSWADVREVVEVFPKNHANDAWAKDIATHLVTALGGSSVDWPVEPLALPVLSSRMSARAFAGRMQLEWHTELVAVMLKDHLVRTVAPGAGIPGEAYWKLDEEKRRDLLAKDGRTIGTVLLDRDATEFQVIERITQDKQWVIKAGNRRYLIDFRLQLSETDKNALDLTIPDQYQEAWAKHIKGLIPLAWNADLNAAKPDWYPFGYMHSIDLSPQLITEEFSKLKAAYDVAMAAAGLGDAILAKFPEMVERDPNYVRMQAEHATDLKSRPYLPRARINTLKQRAAKLGYQLATGFDFNGVPDDQVLVPTGPGVTTPKKVAIGRLYVAQESVATYSVMQSEYVTSWKVGPFSLPGGGDILPGVSLPGLSDVGNILSGLGLGLVSIGSGGLSIPGLPGGGIPFPGLPGIPGLPGSSFGPQRHRRDYPVSVTVRYTDLREVDVDAEPWEMLRQQLQAAGFQCLMAETSEQGYVVEGDVPLREILSRCLVDELYRQKLAVFVPIYQQSFDRGMVKVKYVVAIRPECGSEPLGFPSIYCAEDLSYRAEWRGTELGELLHSISLAPGEEREVMIARSMDRKVEQIDSITSALDITKSDKLDLSSSIQDTLSKEQNSKNSSNWNVEAKGSYGPFSGSAGGGGSNESSVKDFAETIKKSAMQSTREMRVNQKQEIKSSTTITTTINTSESTKSKFSNINQGRTLNIQFHEVNNIYKAGLVVENLRLTYVPSVELIQGLGIHDVLTFGLRDLSALLACANNDVALTGGDFIYDLPTLERRILRTVVRTILREYVSADLPQPDANDTLQNPTEIQLDKLLDTIVGEGARAFGLPVEAATSLKKVFAILEDSLNQTDTVSGEGQYASTLDECQRYVEVLTKLYQKGQVLEPHTLTAPSTATYADAQVGLSPSTEPYSERMREAEISLKYAEIEGQHSEADARRRLAGLPASDRRSTLKASLDRQPGGMLRVEVYPPFEVGQWSLLCDERMLARAHVARPSTTIEIAPTSGADWPRTGGHRWALVSADQRERIELPIF